MDHWKSRTPGIRTVDLVFMIDHSRPLSISYQTSTSFKRLKASLYGPGHGESCRVAHRFLQTLRTIVSVALSFAKAWVIVPYNVIRTSQPDGCRLGHSVAYSVQSGPFSECCSNRFKLFFCCHSDIRHSNKISYKLLPVFLISELLQMQGSGN